MDVCKRGHPLDEGNLRVRRTRHDRYVRRECRACARELERLRQHRAGNFRRWFKAPDPSMRDVLTREEELAALVEQQERDMKFGDYVPQGWLRGRPVYSLDDDLAWLTGMAGVPSISEWMELRSVFDADVSC